MGLSSDSTSNCFTVKDDAVLSNILSLLKLIGTEYFVGLLL